jgi:class 3 adenylate cyclase
LATVELASILITDLVGSTGLESRVGPARADELRREHFGVLGGAIKACEGQEVKNTGDGVMVAFASPSGAVECGVHMQQLMERRNRSTDEQLHLRIGIAAGEATIEGGDYFGMPSIEAARLCDKAASDGILVSAAAKLLVGRTDGLSFESIGMLELKGIPEPSEAFAVRWEPLGVDEVVGGSVLPAVLRSVPQVAYVGRVEEHRWLGRMAREVRDGRRRIVFLSGEPGIGKTRLAAHTALDNHNAGFTVCWGAATEDLGAPYGPWIQALSHYVEHAPDQVLAAHVERHGGEITRLIRDSLAARAAGVPAPQETDPETGRYLLFEAVAGLIQAASDHGPVLLVLDDLQWADSQTLSLLKHVAAATSDSALLVLGIYRESDLDRGHPLADALADLHRLDGVERRALGGLEFDEVAEVVTVVAGIAMDAAGLELARDVAQETDGNPFFVAEIMRHLSESGAISQGSDGQWELRSPIADLALPHSLREVVCRRVERLGDELEQILTMASVVGLTFDVELLDLLVDGDEEDLLDALEGALKASVLVESAQRVGRFRFAHPLIKHAVYDAIGATRRGRLHRRVAEALEQLCLTDSGERLVAEFLEDTIGSAGGAAAILAYHWREAGDSPRAVDYLIKAAEGAELEGAQAETVALFNQALELIPEGDADRRREVNLKRAVAFARYSHVVFGDAPDASNPRRARRGGEGVDRHHR